MAAILLSGFLVFTGNEDERGWKLLAEHMKAAVERVREKAQKAVIDAHAQDYVLTAAEDAALPQSLDVETRTHISDRQKGLHNAIATVFPFATERHCAKHVQDNLKVNGKAGPEAMDIFTSTAFSTVSGDDFNSRMNELLAESILCNTTVSVMVVPKVNENRNRRNRRKSKK